MLNFIVKRIEEAADRSIEEGREKYASWFVNTTLYVKKYKADADAILTEDGYADVIGTSLFV